MIISFLYVILALLGLSFLIFIHELGHYLMARWVGMRVETFSIGFGKPLLSWESQGTKWQVGWLFFGGYVKIAGTETDDGKDPYQVSDGFFGKGPWARIKVALAGPVVNIVFAFILFFALWSIGGREKNFGEFTHKIGWVDTASELYIDGVRPGDEVVKYDNQPYSSAKDHIYLPSTSSGDMKVSGAKVNYLTGKKEAYDYDVKIYPHPNAVDKGIDTAGIIAPASYVIYDDLPGGVANALIAGSPMLDSGIEKGDRLVWIDGEPLFSQQQLNRILNDDKVLLTIQRKGETLLRRVSRVEAQELKLDSGFKEELTDWQYEAGLTNAKLQTLYTIPYNLTNDAIVEERAKFIDKDNEQEAFPAHLFSDRELPLEPGDKIIAINGDPISQSYQLIGKLQERRVNIIVQRHGDNVKPILWNVADVDFDGELNWNDLNAMAQSLGTEKPIANNGNLFLLKTVTPKKLNEFDLPPEMKLQLANEVIEQRKAIEKIEDTEKRNHAFKELEKRQSQLLLGLPAIQDKKVLYNPTPLELSNNVSSEIFRTVTGLVTGNMNPKAMGLSGPVGIIKAVHDYSMVSIKEALFWFGVISLNLGIINLFPIPVLDGGTIMLSLFELVTRRKIHPKTMEKLILPFAVLLIGFFVYLTFNDLERILQKFLPW